MHKKYQDLSRFHLPGDFRGRSPLFVQLWWLVQSTLFRRSPQFAYKYRAALLRFFGARVGQGTVIRPTVTITYPWNVEIGDYAWIGDHAVLYSLNKITIGDHAVVSQLTYLCGGDHDPTLATFPIRSMPVTIGSQCWIATDTFVGPGVTIGEGTVVGARSSVFSSLPPGMFCVGSPCAPVRPRIMIDGLAAGLRGDGGPAEMSLGTAFEDRAGAV